MRMGDTYGQYSTLGTMYVQELVLVRVRERRRETCDSHSRLSALVLFEVR